MPTIRPASKFPLTEASLRMQLRMGKCLSVCFSVLGGGRCGHYFTLMSVIEIVSVAH